MLDSFDVDYIDIETLMWQTGYLTIDKAVDTPRGVMFYLGIPNLEVELSLFGSIADFITRTNDSAIVSNNLYMALLNQDLNTFKQELISLYASIAYTNFTGEKLYEYEGYYVSVFYSYMKALGVELVAEDITNKGRIDLTLKFDSAIYIIEFKEDGKDALGQIKQKKYYEKYINEKKSIYLIGIEFDKKERNISRVEWEMSR